jgi:hypothetical protein
MTDGSIHEGRFDTSNVLPLDSPTGGSLTEFFELCEFEKAPARLQPFVDGEQAAPAMD